MKVKELIEMLETLPAEEEVFFLPENSCYPEDFTWCVRRGREIRTFWGRNIKANVIGSGQQVGAI